MSDDLTQAERIKQRKAEIRKLENIRFRLWNDYENAKTERLKCRINWKIGEISETINRLKNEP